MGERMNYLKNTLDNVRKTINNQLNIQQEFLNSKEIEDVQARDQRINWRVTTEEKELIKLMAQAQHMDISEFLRQLVFNKYINDFIKS